MAGIADVGPRLVGALVEGVVVRFGGVGDERIDEVLGEPCLEVEAVLQVLPHVPHHDGRHADAPVAAVLLGGVIQGGAQLAHELGHGPSAVGEPAGVRLVERAGVKPVPRLEALDQRGLVLDERGPAVVHEADAVYRVRGHLPEDGDHVAAGLGVRVGYARGRLACAGDAP